jgi:hypothetical protein
MSTASAANGCEDVDKDTGSWGNAETERCVGAREGWEDMGKGRRWVGVRSAEAMGSVMDDGDWMRLHVTPCSRSARMSASSWPDAVDIIFTAAVVAIVRKRRSVSELLVSTKGSGPFLLFLLSTYRAHVFLLAEVEHVQV